MSLSDYDKGGKALWQAGCNFERERIIALLETELYSCSKCDRDGASLIALIKGENK